MFEKDWTKMFYKKLQDNNLKIAIVGLGYVGLPLALAFAKKYEVYGFDVDKNKIGMLNKAQSYIVDVSSEDLIKFLHKSFYPSADDNILDKADAIFITVPTPVHVDGSPNMDYVISASQTVAKHLKSGKLVVLESTVYPGATREVVIPILETSGLKAGTNFGVVFSPERVTPGNKEYSVEKMPKVVGGMDNESTELAYILYSSVLEAPVIKVSNCKTAEAVKVLENTFRFINISLVNELAMVFENMGIDIWEVIKGASSKPIGFMPHYPGPGIGGHCIPVDPLFLLYKIRRYDLDSNFIEMARKINTIMPLHMVNLVEYGLRKFGKELRDSNVLVAGVAYKPEVNDSRESPAFDIIEELEYSGAKVQFYDPYIDRIYIKGKEFQGLKSIGIKELMHYDAIVLATNHKALVTQLKELLPKLEKSVVVVDGRNSLDTREIRKKHTYLCIGKPRGEI
ncbi:nucleotide sugar dehydrogenase [Candidatus Aciduliprofundum boonei]|uniref:UDP-N-acetyl-D-mannosamine dehydrogenase n=1 Tax=Aciduliprofundum boonei (strain DSM 19572 / T469) TaxID=439481 RepID=B5IDH5_ACIB4|nr:nucleotide sugar dehydrogenase [Candidatus Aciduliprofundum boonei]ADD08052.1 nucleotide sugar dehydrogenase [Aciduliprofundum boonei T469]EDY35492.1 nucleotide sugar dehydrogenase subfamily [Aciduliprofundum boonei T469]EDY35559.1 nucleotide sugar dehydrogenase subfamily [Aciduliprofundum boonei T469]HII55079.1 nucleotide sugar dehydrogenase [Candidatus Aciduliprofundum boonei]